MSWLWAFPIGIGALIGMVVFFERRGGMKVRLGNALGALKVHSEVNRARKKIYEKVKKRINDIDVDSNNLFK